MEPLVTVSGTAAAFPAADIDTDAIMPKQFLKGIDRTGLDRGVFFDLKTKADGSPDPDFILHRPAWRGSSILVVGPNFGCGSSREHAVWGLKQIGVRVLLGTSYSGIFFDNCARNGLLALALEATTISRLMTAAGNPSTNAMSVDLPDQTIQLADGSVLPFEVNPMIKAMLISGLDPVGATLQLRATILQFEATYHVRRPWLQQTESLRRLDRSSS